MWSRGSPSKSRQHFSCCLPPLSPINTTFTAWQLSIMHCTKGALSPEATVICCTMRNESARSLYCVHHQGAAYVLSNTGWISVHSFISEWLMGSALICLFPWVPKEDGLAGLFKTRVKVDSCSQCLAQGWASALYLLSQWVKQTEQWWVSLHG